MHSSGNERIVSPEKKSMHTCSTYSSFTNGTIDISNDMITCHLQIPLLTCSPVTFTCLVMNKLTVCPLSYHRVMSSNMDPITADHFCSDLGVAQKTVDARVSAGQTHGANTSCEKRSGFIHKKLALNPLLEIIGNKHRLYKSLHRKIILVNLWLTKIKHGHDPMKITYGTLYRRSLMWEPQTHT